MFATAGARISTLVSETNCAASSGSVSASDSGAFRNNFGEPAYVSNFPFDEDIWADGFQRLDCLFCPFDIFLEWPIGKIEDDFIKTGFRRGFSLPRGSACGRH